MATASPDPGSPAARRSAEAALRTVIAKHAPAHAPLIATLRRAIRKRLPTAHELIYEYTSWLAISYSPNDHGYDGVLAIRADAKGVALYLSRGKELPDPEKLLRGSGKLVRFVPIDSAATLRRPAVTRLVDEAIARNPIPFPRTGTGSIVMQSASTKPRRRSKS
ncbi:MAG TPA: hypothetical protein VGM20_02305 [Gemmatimonadales bacterium]|jgi:hypothetical protein